MRNGILRPRQRRLAWAGFLLLAAYSPVVAWLKPDDTWLLPITVAGLSGYLLVVDDVLRRRAARDAGPDTTTRGRRTDDDLGPNSGAPATGAAPQVPEPAGERQASEPAGQRPER